MVLVVVESVVLVESLSLLLVVDSLVLLLLVDSLVLTLDEPDSDWLVLSLVVVESD